MDTPLKQRLVGLAVLIALAVIFVPMLLDGSGSKERQRQALSLPPEPIYEIPNRLGPQPDAVQDVPEPPVESPSASSAPPEAPPPDKPDVVQVRPSPEPTESAAVSVPTPTSEPSAPAEHHDPLAAWVVQVGSFGEKKNAQGLRDRLRAKGYSAFVEKYASDGKSMYRVKIGPELKREKALDLQARLQKEETLKGIVVEHP